MGAGIRKRRKSIGALVLAVSVLTAGMRFAPVGERTQTVQAAEVQAEELAQLAGERDILALVYLCEEREARAEASDAAEAVATLTSGQTVYIQDAVYDDAAGTLWLQVSFWDGETLRTGYIERAYLACSDERFLAWEQAFRQSSVAGTFDGVDRVFAAAGEVTADVAQFPASYQSGLMALTSAHPQWVFVPMDTGLKWDTVITEELKGGKSLVHKSFPDYTKDGAYDDGNWFYATREILEYYMDPRNAMTEAGIFQFELLTYNKTYHTETAVESFLANTFMKSPDKAPGTSMTYAHIFWAVGSEEGREVSPFHLAARVYQEQGKGTSGLISGTYPGYEGYYNHFNVGATGTTTEQVIVNGLKYAKEHDWTNAYYSILGGSDVISANYIKKGQDTLYLEKYNVNPKAYHALYTHQYMQNISAPSSEGASIKRLYANADSLDNSFVFKIPVFDNMPSTACPYPTEQSATNLTLKIPSGYDTVIWVDGVPYTSQSVDGGRGVNVEAENATTAVVYSYTKDGVPGGMYVWTLTYQNGTYKATAQTGLQDLVSYHGFSMRVAGEASMRVKFGMDVDGKAQLLADGVNGYRLKEYGTLITTQRDFAAAPLVIGGEAVERDKAWAASDGSSEADAVYETVAGRARYVTQLAEISSGAYSTAYACRGYVILSKDGADYVLYGPIVSKTMRGLAEQILQSGAYAEGSDAYDYLEQIVN